MCNILHSVFVMEVSTSRVFRLCMKSQGMWTCRYAVTWLQSTDGQSDQGPWRSFSTKPVCKAIREIIKSLEKLGLRWKCVRDTIPTPLREHRSLCIRRLMTGLKSWTPRPIRLLSCSPVDKFHYQLRGFFCVWIWLMLKCTHVLYVWFGGCW